MLYYIILGMTTHMNIPFELTNLGIPPLAYRIGRPAPAAATPRRTERRERRVPADPDERVGKLLRAARDAKEHTAEIEKKIAETKRKLVEAEKDGDDMVLVTGIRFFSSRNIFFSA